MDKRCANILLLSDKEFEYKTLVDAGYKNVFWFKSTLRANEYFKGKEEELEKFDIILMGSSSVKNIDNYKYQQLFYGAINGEKRVPHMCFFSTRYEDDESKRFIVSYPCLIGERILKKDFLRILNDSIPEKLRDEKIEIPDIEEKDIVLPRHREDIRILFMGSNENQDLVKKFLEDAGFTQCDYVKSNNFTLRDNVESLVNYDLVVCDSEFNGMLTLLGDEFQDYMKDKGKSIYLAVYDFNYKGLNLNDNNVYVEALPTENPQNKEFVKFRSLEVRENVIKDIMGIVINMYTSYNNNLGDGGYPDKEALDAKYNRQCDEFIKKNKIVSENMDKVKYIRSMLEKYCRFYNKNQRFGQMLNIFNDLKIDILEDGVSVALLAGNKEEVRMTVSDKENKDEKDTCLHFYLEYLTGNGMCSPVRRTCTSRYCVDNKGDYPSDEEIKKIEKIYMSIKKELPPIVDTVDTRNAHNSRGNENKKSNKKYNKRYNKRYV